MAAARAVGAAGGDAAKEAYDSDVIVDEFYAAFAEFSDAERLEGGALDDGEEYAELLGLGGDLEGAETRYARKKKEVAAAHPANRHALVGTSSRCARCMRWSAG